MVTAYSYASIFICLFIFLSNNSFDKQSVSYITENIYCKPRIYACTQLQYRFAVISKAPSRAGHGFESVVKVFRYNILSYMCLNLIRIYFYPNPDNKDHAEFIRNTGIYCSI